MSVGTEAKMSASRRPILFVINSLEGGGAERIFTLVVGALAPDLDHPVEIILLDKTPSAYDAPPGVPVTVLDARGGLSASVAKFTALARRRRPALIVSFLSRANCAAVIAGAACGAPVVISERVHTTSHFSAGGRGALSRAAIRAIYPRATRIIAVSEGVAEDLVLRFGAPRVRTVVINNPVDVTRIRAAASEPPAFPPPKRFIVAVGRLTPAKNFAMLIEAYARARLSQWLVILGEGPERPALERQVEAAGLSGCVLLPGHVDNPYAIMARAECFVSSSNAEGFPNALVEAMALGLPVVATDCPSGPAEILRGGAGVLIPVNDTNAMANALTGMTEDVRAALGTRAARRVTDFAPDAAIARYRAVLTDALCVKAFVP